MENAGMEFLAKLMDIAYDMAKAKYPLGKVTTKKVAKIYKKLLVDLDVNFTPENTGLNNTNMGLSPEDCNCIICEEERNRLYQLNLVPDNCLGDIEDEVDDDYDDLNLDDEEDEE